MVKTLSWLLFSSMHPVPTTSFPLCNFIMSFSRCGGTAGQDMVQALCLSLPAPIQVKPDNHIMTSPDKPYDEYIELYVCLLMSVSVWVIWNLIHRIASNVVQSNNASISVLVLHPPINASFQAHSEPRTDPITRSTPQTTPNTTFVCVVRAAALLLYNII